MSAYNFFVSGPKFTKFFRPIGDCWSSTFQIFDTPICSWDICDQSPIVKNRVKFRTFFTSQIWMGAPLQNLYSHYHACLAARRLVKFPWVIVTIRKVIGTLVLNFRPNFNVHPSPSLPNKSTSVGPNSHILLSGQWTNVHRPCFAKRGRNHCRSRIFPISDFLILSVDIRDQIRKLCKIGSNFACFWPPNFFRGGPPNFWTCIIKLTQISHVAKFRGDRLTELGDPVAN